MTDADAPRSIALHRLPVQVRMLVRVMGEAPAYALLQRRGGTPLSVPKSLRGEEAARLANWCGSPEGAARLVAEMAGETVQLPKYDAVLRQMRHQRVVEMRVAGCLLSDIAIALGYTVRQVINILAAAGRPCPVDEAEQAFRAAQSDLFGNNDEEEEQP